jgi:hypothetical protein
MVGWQLLGPKGDAIATTLSPAEALLREAMVTEATMKLAKVRKREDP